MSLVERRKQHWCKESAKTMPAETTFSSFSSLQLSYGNLSSSSPEYAEDFLNESMDKSPQPHMGSDEKACKFLLPGLDDIDSDNKIELPNGDLSPQDVPDVAFSTLSTIPKTFVEPEDIILNERKSEDESFCRFRSKSEGAVNRHGHTTLKGVLKKNSSPDEKLKRRVSFADTSGFQLEQIQSYDVQHTDSSDDDYLLPAATESTNSRQTIGGRGFVPYFTLPWSAPGQHRIIYAVLEDRKICFEALTVSPWRITGTILVKNLSFGKRIFVRKTTDKWKTFEDVEATFLTSVNANVDRFRFELQFPFKMPAGTQLELAFGYEAPERAAQFWDNNCQNNYAFWYNDK